MAKAITVSELNNTIEELLKKNFGGLISVIGEVSNCKLSKTHLFFTIKDASGSISGTIWSYGSKNRKVKLENGLKAVFKGYIKMFKKSGSYYLNTVDYEIDGTGDIHLDYLLTKEHYEKLGYFDEQHKRGLDVLKTVSKVGVVTSKTGAAIKDFLYMLEKNDFKGELFIKHCTVQGNDCPKSVSDHIKELDELGLDVIVVTRGGGSYEDLFGFSNSLVIEAIYEAKTPVISAIGHEVDTPLSDLVADVRVPTPSIAGEVLAKRQNEIFSFTQYSLYISEMEMLILTELTKLTNDAGQIKSHLESLHETIMLMKNELRDRIYKLGMLVNNRLLDSKTELEQVRQILIARNPKNILEMGYAIITDGQGNTITSTNDVKNSEKLKLTLKDGDIEIVIAKINNGEPHPRTKNRRIKKGVGSVRKGTKSQEDRK